MRLLPINDLNDLDQERRYIIQTLDNRSPDDPPLDLDWTRLKDIACTEGVAGILYGHLKDRDIPQSALSPLNRYYQSVAAQNLISLDALQKLEHALDREKKIEIVTLKGASLLENIYPSVGIRPMGDLDLMVRPRDQERFVGLLHAQGYQTDPLIPHILRKGGSVIDVHIHALNTDRITNRAKLFPSGMEPVWANSVPWQEGYKWLRRPDDVDNILLLCQHAMKHSFSSLIWLMDIHELLRDRDSAFWARLFKRADHLSQRKSLSYTLFLLNGFFGMEPLQGSGLEDLFKGLSRLERGILGTMFRGQTLHRLGPLLALLCIPGMRARITFLWETLFPEQEIIEQEFACAYKGKRRFFYPARLFQIAVLAFRQSSLIIAALMRG